MHTVLSEKCFKVRASGFTPDGRQLCEPKSWFTLLLNLKIRKNEDFDYVLLYKLVMQVSISVLLIISSRKEIRGEKSGGKDKKKSQKKEK
jgi:hypothetical protein